VAQLTGTWPEILAVLKLLAATPERIGDATAGRLAATLGRAPQPGEWSAVAILAHLRGCQDVWAKSIYAMLEEEEPLLAVERPRDRARAAGYARLEFAPSFDAFRQGRIELLGMLRHLPEPGWRRAAIIGRHRHSVFSQASRLAVHEDEHCAQLEGVLARLAAG
jgi:hypothetical protein